ncbi:hypothetical protein AAF712_010633 [Marasmius tenuissimus]|uniref:F-box domain-containing protein n=1 Tax=Marasmius tenuissimus TaxID=585030 RepID=A0ABR2ZMG1_9AGAR|nr:hypothetical protein PM082_000070 [Marasmius tenuissimus]
MPITRHVPAEIWKTVFEIVVHSTSSKYSLIFQHDMLNRARIFGAPSLILSQVSPLWRAIMMNLPSLWSSVSIEFVGVSRSFVRLLTLYLTNSGQHPLILRITRELRHTLPPLSEEGVAAWKALSPHLNRCEELYLGVCSHFEFPPIHDLSFPNLLVLDEEEEAMSYPLWFWKAVEAAPRLSRARINAFNPFRTLPYHQLTSLEVVYCGKGDAQGVLELLPTCHRLLSLEINQLDGNGDEVFVVPPRTIEVPTLQRLSISNCTYKPPQTVNPMFSAFCQLSLPALTDLDMSCHYWPPALHTLLERSSASVKKVKLNLGPKGITDYRHPFSVIPSFSCLTHLELSLCPFDFPATVLAEMLLELQTGRDSDQPLILPQLTHLLLDASPQTLTQPVGDGLVQLVRSRRLASHPLKITTINLTNLPGSPTHLEPAIAERVRALEDAGFDVTIDEYPCW